MEYIDLNNELSKRMEKAQTELEGIQNQLDNWRKNGFFYRLTHRRELRELTESRDGAADTIDSIMQEQSDLSRRIDIYQENQFNTMNELLSKVTEEITQHAREEGLYLSKDFEVVNFSDLEAPEKNPQFDDYSWGIIHGDGHPEYFQAESIQDLIDKAVKYGDMIPVSLENQEKIIAEIEAAYHFDKGERISLQNSDQGLQVIVSESDEFLLGNPLLNKKISYDELTHHIESFEETDYTVDGKRMYPVETEYDKGLEKSLEAAKDELSQKGLYFSRDIYVFESGPTNRDYALTLDCHTFSKQGDRLEGIPTKEEILAFAEENKIITRINPEEQKTLSEELNKITFGADDVVYSYSTVVGDLVEGKDGPYFGIFDDSDRCFDTLSYNAERDKWVGDTYDFEVDNPVKSLKEKYLGEDPERSLSKVLKKMNKTELELMQLIDNAKNESIDNHFADWGRSSYVNSKALDEYVERIQNSEMYSKVKSIYEKMIHGYIDASPKEKVDMGVGGTMITKALDEKNTEFFGLKENQRVIEGDPKLLDYSWGLSYNKQERRGKPTLEEFVSEGDRYRAGKSVPGGEKEVAFHVWTMTEGVDAQGNPKLLSKEGTLKLMDEIIEEAQTVERTEELPEGWRWRTFSDGSGSLLSPKGDHYFSFKEFALGGKVVTNPETGESEYPRDMEQFKKKSEQWVSKMLFDDSMRQEKTQPLQGKNESEVEMEL